METKTLQATPETLTSVINSLVTPAQIDVPLVTGALVRVYYRNYYTVHYYRANGEKKCNYDLLTKNEAINTALHFINRALHLWEPYLLLPNKAYYTPDMIGTFIIKARDTKHGLKYDIVRMVGYKHVSPTRFTFTRRLFRFQRYFTSDYRGACAVAEYLNAKQKNSVRFLCYEFVKESFGKKTTLRWVAGSNIKSWNLEEKFNVKIYRPEIKSFLVDY